MKERGASRSGLFLLELMISIVFFAIAATGCVQVFAKAHIFSQQAEQLDQAVSIAQSLAEVYSGRKTEKTQYYYGKQGESCEKEMAAYQAELTQTETDGMMESQITVKNATSQKTIYHLQTASYLPDGIGGGNE